MPIFRHSKNLGTKPAYTQEELIEALRRRDQQAFSWLYDNYSRALFGVISAIVKEREEAEDMLQGTFLKIWNNFSAYDETKGRLYTWMLNIARNLAIDSTRSKHQKMRPKIQGDSDSVYQYGHLSVENRSHENIGLNRIIDNLKEEQRTIIDLAYFEGYTQEEIAGKLAMPLGTVKTKVRQALMALRELTKKEQLR